MDPDVQNQESAQYTVGDSNYRKPVLISLGIIVLLLLGGFYFLWANVHAPVTQTQAVPAPLQLIDTVRAGDYSGALDQYDAILSSPTTSADSLARATRNITGVAFRLSGDIQDVIDNVRALKETVVNPKIKASIRAANLDAMGHAYMDSGENSAIIDEIFKDAPLNAYRVEGDVPASLRNLYQLSYNITPTTRAAIDIASFSVLDALSLPEASWGSASTTAIIADAKHYMQLAQGLSQKEMADNPSYAKTHRYSGYLFWHAFSTAGLALMEGGAYKGQYKAEYAALLDHLGASGDDSAQYEPLAHWHYAVFLYLIDNDTAAAREQLTEAAAKTIETRNRDFISLIANKKNNQEALQSDFLGKAIFSMAALSPEFKSLVDSI